MSIFARLDSWVNTVLGFGGAQDKRQQTRYGAYVHKLSDPELTAMFRTEHFSAKIVDVYPREALREGFELGGYEDDTGEREDEVCAYLRQWSVRDCVENAAIWGRLYGGARVWLGSLTVDPALPFRMGEQIDFLRVVDRRFLQARPFPLDVHGQPTLYDIVPEEGGAMVGPVHASRLVPFGGARTDARTRRDNGWWDDSVLQRAYDALKSDGTMWGATEQMVSEFSLGIMKLKNLYTTLANDTARGALNQRMAFFRQTRSNVNNLVLDYDTEDYRRDTVSFAGLSDLNDASIKRVASAAETPVAILLSDEPSGLNATGDSSIRWWLMRVHAYRTGDLEKSVLYLSQALLAQSGIAGMTPESVAKLTVKWPNLWTPSAAEQADIRQKTSAADASDIDKGILTPEEVALSRYGEDGYSQETTIDRDLRATPTADELASAAREGDTNANAAPAADAPTDVQKQALNGAQLASVQEIVRGVAAEEIPRDSGVAMIRLGFPDLSPAEADAVIGSAGKGFKPAKPEPPAFGVKPNSAEPGAPADQKKPDATGSERQAPPQSNATDPEEDA